MENEKINKTKNRRTKMHDIQNKRTDCKTE